MAFFNRKEPDKKELEILRAENQRLQEELERVRDGKAFDKATIEALTRGTDNYRERLLSFQREVKEQAADNTDLRRCLTEASVRPHNERGAGRKRKATPEQIELIRALRASGKSYAGIAKILSEQSGDTWNKTTVRDTYMAAGN